MDALRPVKREELSASKIGPVAPFAGRSTMMRQTTNLTLVGVGASHWSQWRIDYSSEASNDVLGGAGHLFQVFLLKPEQETWQGDIVINEVNKKTIEGETHIYKSGTFYFKSNSANGDWEIRVMVPEN
jgi:hypothetical protein